MSKETFNQLMGQYSAEAETQRVVEEREREQRAMLTKIGNVFCWLLLVGVAVAGYIFRDELGQASEKFVGGGNHSAQIAEAADAGEAGRAESPNKFKELLKVTEKHAAAVDSSGNLDARQMEEPSKPNRAGK